MGGGGGGIFIYSCSARIISFKQLISRYGPFAARQAICLANKVDISAREEGRGGGGGVEIDKRRNWNSPSTKRFIPLYSEA